MIPPDFFCLHSIPLSPCLLSLPLTYHLPAYLTCMHVWLCLTLCDHMDPPIFSVHGIFQARILMWVAVSFSRGSSWPREDPRLSSCISYIGRWIFFSFLPLCLLEAPYHLLWISFPLLSSLISVSVKNQPEKQDQEVTGIKNVLSDSRWSWELVRKSTKFIAQAVRKGKLLSIDGISSSGQLI